MWRSIVSVLAVVSVGAAQISDYLPIPGTRSLWIPYKTLSGVPIASILGHDDKNQTTYVISCPTAQPGCAIAPNITLTEGTDFARWASSTSGSATSGTVVIECPSLTSFPVTCNQAAHGGGNVIKTSAVLQKSAIVYQAVDVTKLATNTATLPTTKLVTTTATTTATPTSTGGVQTVGAQWMGVGGAVGAGLVALMAL